MKFAPDSSNSKEEIAIRNLTIYYWFGFPIPMKERFQMIKTAGFDGVFLWWGDEFKEMDGDKSLQLQLASRNGLFIENVHLPYEGVNCLWTDQEEGDAFENKLTNTIRDCSRHEIPTVVLHISQGDTPPPPSQIGLDRFRRLVDVAEKNHVNIALENLRKPEYLDFIFSNIQSDRLGFCYDSGHENCYSKGADLLSKYGSKLMALHLHDNDGSEDQHQIPGEGDIDWRRVTQKLNKLEYSGSIALEVTNEFSRSKGQETPEQFLRIAFEKAKKLS